MEPQESQPQAQPAMQGYAIPFAIVIAGLAIAGAIYFGDKRAPTQQVVAAQNITFNPITDTDHILGNPKAKVTIVEYSDTECPWCKVFHPTMQRIISEYGADGNVAWVYRHLIAVPQHTNAYKEAEATECAAKIGGNTKFWSYLNKIFEITPANNGLDPKELPKVAKDLGIDETAFSTCLTSNEMKKVVEESIARAPQAGTPHSFIVKGGKIVGVIEGAQSYETVKAKIEAVLK